MNVRRVSACILMVSLGAAVPLFGANARLAAQAPRHAAAQSATAPATRPVSRTTHAATRPNKAATRPALSPQSSSNPFLPAPVPVDSFFIDLSPTQKLPTVTPAGFEPLYSADDWRTYLAHYAGEEGQTAKNGGVDGFAEKLIAAAAEPDTTPGLRRLLLLRAAVVCYRGKEGFTVADKAVAAYLAAMDKKSASQVGALWAITNAMARTSATPKDQRLRYDALAARANMQLTLLLLDADQVGAADAMIRQVGYHEGWLKKDAATRGQIAQVRTEVHQKNALMDYLATQYQPAMHDDVRALTLVYLYGRYVKGSAASVANIPDRVRGTGLAQLAGALNAATPEKPDNTFAAAERLRALAASVPDALLRARTLYAALQLYDAYLASPLTERERVQRTVARIAREGVIADGARRGHAIDPFAPAAAPATQPALAPGKPATRTEPAAPVSAKASPSAAAPPAAKVFQLPAEDDPAALERSVLRDGHQPWRLDPATAAQAAAASVAQDDATPAPLAAHLMALAEKLPTVERDTDDHAEASWSEGGEHVIVSLMRTKPEPGKGIWIAQRLTVKP